MAIKVLHEVNRTAGLATATSTTIIAGQPCIINSTPALTTFAGSGVPQGLAAESNYFFPLQATSGLTAGVGYDYTNFDRGGLISMFVNGGIFQLYNDGSGNPFLYTDTFTVNSNCYANSSGLVTITSSANPVIGVVISETNQGNATTMTVTIKSLI